MKGASTVTLMLALLLVGSPCAASAADGPYASLDLGQANYGGGASGNDTAYRLTGGYRFNSHLSVEAGYTDLGSVQAYDGICRFSDPGVPCVPEYTFAKAHGYLVEGVAGLPLGSDWSLYARAGVAFVHTEAGKLSGGSVAAESSSSNAAFTYGFGIAWSSSETLSWHLGWDDYSSLVDSTGGKFSVTALALGVTYSFK